MRHSTLLKKQLRVLLHFCIGFGFFVSSGFSQDGFFSGMGSIDLGGGFDENVLRIPAGATSHGAQGLTDAYAYVAGRWQKQIGNETNEWTFHASGDAKAHRVYKQANTHHLFIRSQVVRHLNSRVRGAVGLQASQRKMLEVNWSDQEQWQSMMRTDIQSDARMIFDVHDNLQAQLGVTYNLVRYFENSPNFGHQIFAIDAAWNWSLLGRKRGLRNFKLIDPQRTKDVGLLSLYLQFQQRNFSHWQVRPNFSTYRTSTFGPKRSDSRRELMPHHVWVNWKLRVRYTSSNKQGWTAFLETFLSKRSDESLGDFGQNSMGLGSGVLYTSPRVNFEMSLFQEAIAFESRYSGSRESLTELEYGITSWNVEVEFFSMGSWSYLVKSMGHLRSSNYVGEIRTNRDSLRFQSLMLGVRWHCSRRRL